MVSIEFDLNLFGREFRTIVVVNEADSTSNIIMESVRWNAVQKISHYFCIIRLTLIPSIRHRPMLYHAMQPIKCKFKHSLAHNKHTHVCCTMTKKSYKFMSRVNSEIVGKQHCDTRVIYNWYLIRTRLK